MRAVAPMTQMLDVTYLELRTAPAAVRAPQLAGRVALERPSLEPYLTMYRRVGESLRWDQRLHMPRAELERLLESGRISIYVLREAAGEALGFCEFDRSRFPDIELKNFGLIPEAYGQGLGPWLLSIALEREWRTGPKRIWLHTDTWDHPAAVRVYRKAGFQVMAVRHERVDDL